MVDVGEATVLSALTGHRAGRMRVRLHYRFCRLVARWFYLLYLNGRIYRVDRVPRTGGAVLASNHQSFLDPLLATLALPRECHFMARESLFRGPLFRRLIVSVNAFPVKRGTSDIGALRTALARLATGALVTTFPESTRTTDGRVGLCQPGVILLAKKARVPLVPVAIEGAYDVWPRHRKIPGSGRIWVEYGEPIPSETLGESSRAESARRLTDAIRSIHNRLRRRAGKEPFDYED